MVWITLLSDPGNHSRPCNKNSNAILSLSRRRSNEARDTPTQKGSSSCPRTHGGNARASRLYEPALDNWHWTKADSKPRLIGCQSRVLAHAQCGAARRGDCRIGHPGTEADPGHIVSSGPDGVDHENGARPRRRVNLEWTIARMAAGRSGTTRMRLTSI
jgi:hypothetical protein